MKWLRSLFYKYISLVIWILFCRNWIHHEKCLTTLSSYIYCQAFGQSYTIAAYMDENMNVHRVNLGFMLTLFLNNSDKSNYWHEPKLRPKCNMGYVLMLFKKLRLKQGPLNTILPYIYDYSYISQRLSTHHTPM